MKEYICPCCGVTKTFDDSDVHLNEDLFCQPCVPLLSTHSYPSTTPVVVLDASEAFQLLTDNEKLYAYWIGQASWKGSLICLSQCSPESLAIFTLLLATFSSQPIEELLSSARANGIEQSEIDDILMYSAAFFNNMGNYKSFGDTKFVPLTPQHRLRAFLLCSSRSADEVNKLFDAVATRMYSLAPRHRQLGLGAAQGTSTYFSANCEEADADLAGRFLNSINLSPYNTRLFKHRVTDSSDGHVKYVIMVASVSTTPPPHEHFPFQAEYHFEGAVFEIRRGDHASPMRKAAEALQQAAVFAANDHQREMLGHYATSFLEGSVEAHKSGSRAWIRDKGPAVETYIGFIESYRDPSGVRGEFEGFVACVNKEVSKKFQVLVDSAEDFLGFMPWPKEFEKDVFLRPDFTSLEVIAFGSSGVPAGINIPNYDDIRQDEGFKNVSLGNVLKAGYGASSDKPVSFVLPQDQSLFKALMGPAFEVQVGLHELLGHGSGKLFRASDSSLLKTLRDPLTDVVGEMTHYPENSTWDTCFGKVASNYEECRAECTGIYLCLQPTILEVFGHTTVEEQNDIIFINWLLMVRAGVLALEFYTPSTGAWRQAHMNARYVILRVLLEAGQGLVRIERCVAEDGADDVMVHLDREKILSVGKPAIAAFMLRLQVYKSTADVVRGSEMFSAYSEVSEDMLELREVVLARKEPRKLLVQPNMLLEDGTVQLRIYNATTTGMIASWVERFQDDVPELVTGVLTGSHQVENGFVDDLA